MEQCYQSYQSPESNAHCVKSVRILSYSGPDFPAFGLNTDRYFVSLHIPPECGKMRQRITPNMDNFQAVATLAKFIDQYKIFKDETLARKTGKAKQYWMQSSQMIDLYLALHS